jgi:hypothetical protein
MAPMSRFPAIWWPVLLGAVGALACPPWGPEGFHTSAFLANMTQTPLEVRLFRARGPLDCAAVASDPMNALSSAFAPELCTPLEIGGILPLDRNWSWLGFQPDGGAPAGGAPGADPPCDAVIIRVADLPDTLLTWQQPGQVDVNNEKENLAADRARDALDPHGIYLERAGGRIFAASSPLIASLPLPVTITLPDVACEGLPTIDGGRP